MLDILSVAGSGILLILALTFVVAIARTLFEGVEAFAAFDRAGFTFRNFLHGIVPEDAARDSQICIGESAEIETSAGGIWAAETRTIVKHQS